jgi:2-C-methyl-D-erythritol 4-phosphate cytidylyltransferase
MPKNWNRRFKHNRDKMKTGDILELAEVVRNLSLRDHEKGLSHGREADVRQGQEDPRERAHVRKDMDEEEAAEWLDGVLVGSSPNGAANGARRRRRRSRRRLRRRTREARRASRSAEDAPKPPRRPSRRRRRAHVEVSVWAVLAAAGSGERLGADRPKAFVRLGEQPLLAESLARSTPPTGSTRSSSPRRPAGRSRDPARRGARLRQGQRLRDRGATRADSVRLGVAEVPADAAVVLVHDAARPLLDDAVVERVVTALGEGWDGAVPTLPIPDTVKRVDGEQSCETLPPGRAARRADASGVRRGRPARGAVRLGLDGLLGRGRGGGGRVRIVDGDPRLVKVTMLPTSTGSRALL